MCKLFFETASDAQLLRVPMRGMYNSPSSPAPLQGDVHKADAQKELDEFYNKENIRTLEQNRMYFAHNHTGPTESKNKERLVAFWVFSCSSVSNCIAITASGISLMLVALLLMAFGVWHQFRKSKRRFLPDEWWCAQQKKDAKTPLLVVHHVREKSSPTPPVAKSHKASASSSPKSDKSDKRSLYDAINVEELTMLKKYLTRYLSMNEKRQQESKSRSSHNSRASERRSSAPNSATPRASSSGSDVDENVSPVPSRWGSVALTSNRSEELFSSRGSRQ